MENNIEYIKHTYPNAYEEIRFRLLNKPYLKEEINKHTRSYIKQTMRAFGNGTKFLDYLEYMVSMKKGKSEMLENLEKQTLNGSLNATKLLLQLHSNSEGSDDE